MQPGPTRPAPGHPAEEGAGRIVTAVKIAFVDDEPELLAALHRAVRQSALRQGWDLAFHSDPREALQALSRQPAAVVVMDLKMPGMGGLQLATSLRARAPGTVFIVLSGCNEFQTAIETINRAGVFRYFLKPAAPAELIAGIADAVRHWRAANAEGSDIPAEPDGGPARAPLPAAAEGATGSAPLPGGGAPSKEAGMLALDMLAFGIVVTDSRGRIEIANRYAGEILAARRGLYSDPEGVLRVADRRDQVRLDQSRRKAQDRGEAAALSIEAAEPPLRLLVMPLAEGGRLLHYVTEAGSRAYPADLIAALFDLTPAEARLVGALSAGVDLDQAASDCGVTKSTARSYLKQVFVKTGVTRQAELVRLVLTSMASMEISSARAPAR